MSQIDPNINIVYNKIKHISQTKELKPDSIVFLVTMLIPIVQQVVVDHGKGSYKKQLVLSVIKLIITNSYLDQHSQDSLILLVDTTIPVVVDSLISVARGTINLGKSNANSKCCSIS